ncbi:MAG: CBS domain-containing protein [Beijerinckiaceae bacterium]
MTVASILAQKGRDVVTTLPERTMQDIATVLAERKIGAVIVTESDGKVLGILSERDIVRAMARQGASALDDPVSRHMTSRVVTTTEDATIPDTMERMTAGRFRHLPVVANDRLVGVVSIGDIVKWRLAEIVSEHQALKEYIATA